MTVSPSDADTVADVMAAGAAESTEEAEDVASESRPTLSEALSAVDVLRRYCFEIEGHGLELVQMLSRVENSVLTDAAKMKVQKKITAFFAK